MDSKEILENTSAIACATELCPSPVAHVRMMTFKGIPLLSIQVDLATRVYYNNRVSLINDQLP